MKEVTDLTYETLNKLRDEFSKNPGKYFDFGKLNKEKADEVLSTYFDELPKLSVISDEANTKWFGAQFKQLQLLDKAAAPGAVCPFHGQRDARYDFADGEQKIIATAISDPHWIRNTINQALAWSLEGKPDLNIRFDLVRSKVAFQYSYTSKDGVLHLITVGGELIDVSFPKRDDFRLAHFIASYDDWVTDYNLTNEDTGEVLNFKAESIAGISADIAEVLFEQNARPWNDKKYEKRTNRLFFFGIAEILKNLGLGSKTITDYVANVREKIIDPLDSLYENGTVSKTVADQIAQNARELVDRYTDLGVLNKVWKGIASFVETLVKDPKDDDQEKLKEFIEAVNSNLEIIEKLATMPTKIIDVDSVYDATMDHYL
jgi:hypothetical protein